MSITLLLALLALGLILAMTLAWAIARVPGQSAWIDAIWSFATGLAGVAACLTPTDSDEGPRRFLVAALIGLWSLRLGTHIAQRAAAHGEDPRYGQMRKDWGDGFSGFLFGLMMIQAAAAWLLTLSVMVAAKNPAPFPAWSDFAGVAIILVAVIGEGIADRQLRTFARSHKGKDAVCTDGLWAYSRHPNYFFEWLGWCGYAVIAIGPAASFGWGWVALSGPAFMYVLLVHVSGIPPLEAHMVRSRGDAFRRTQNRISAFWPLPQHEPKGATA